MRADLSQDEVKEIARSIGKAWFDGYVAAQALRGEPDKADVLDRIESAVITAMRDLGYPVRLDA